MSSIQYATQKYQELGTVLSADGFDVADYKAINYGLQFSIEKLNWSGLVRIYQNKKGTVRVDLSQLDQSKEANRVRNLTESDGRPLTTARSHEKSTQDMTAEATSQSVPLPMMGSDESGKGDYFGPLVVACVYVDRKTEARLSEIGVRDSKKLNDSQISKTATSIRAICADKFTVVEIMPERYNQMYANLKREKKSLNDMLAWAHATAIESLLEKVDCERAVVDKFCDESVVLNRLKDKGKQLKVTQIPRAESYIAVAAASILARDRFVTRLNTLGGRYNVQLPKGASDKVVSTAQQLVADNGREVIAQVAKEHFKTTQAVSS